MKIRKLVLPVLWLVAVFLGSCTPSEMETSATTTQIASNIFATQTAVAPSITPTPSPPATPTTRPSPTPTATPNPTETPSATLIETPTGLAASPPSILTLADLPPGFVEMPADLITFFLGEQQLKPGDSFTAYLHREPFQVFSVWIHPFSSPLAQEAYEKLMEDPDFVNNLLKEEGPGMEYTMIPCPPDLGESCFGFTLAMPGGQLGGEGGLVTDDMVTFVTSNLLVNIENVYPMSAEPLISTDRLVLLINEKITTAGETDSNITVSAALCEDELGCVIVGPDDPVVLASIVCLSGSNRGLGLDSQYGIQLALDEHGDVLGHPLKLRSMNDECHIASGEGSARKIITDPQIVAVIGPSCSGTAISAASILSEAGYSLISPSNISPSLTSPNYHQAGYLRTAMNDINQSQVMALFAYDKLGVRRAAIVYDGDPYTYALASAFQSTFEETGGTVVAFKEINAEAEDATPLLSAIAQMEPDMLYFPVFLPPGVLITNAIPDVPDLRGVILAASDALQSADFINSTRGTSEGLYLSAPAFDFSDNARYEEEFIPSYLEKVGDWPQAPFHAHAFDATNMILEAVEKVGHLLPDGTLVIGRKALRDALFATKDFAGLTGMLTCTEFGDCAAVKVVIFQVQNGEFQPVD